MGGSGKGKGKSIEDTWDPRPEEFPMQQRPAVKALLLIRDANRGLYVQVPQSDPTREHYKAELLSVPVKDYLYTYGKVIGHGPGEYASISSVLWDSFLSRDAEQVVQDIEHVVQKFWFKTGGLGSTVQKESATTHARTHTRLHPHTHAITHRENRQTNKQPTQVPHTFVAMSNVGTAGRANSWARPAEP